MQLRYNVSQIEEFLSRRNMREGPIIKELNPLVQSSQLMQVKKQDENDAKLLLQMCDSLTGAQVRPTLTVKSPFGHLSLYPIFLGFKAAPTDNTRP